MALVDRPHFADCMSCCAAEDIPLWAQEGLEHHYTVEPGSEYYGVSRGDTGLNISIDGNDSYNVEEVKVSSHGGAPGWALVWDYVPGYDQKVYVCWGPQHESLHIKTKLIQGFVQVSA